MTIPNTYTNIIAAVQEELEDFGSEFVLNIPSAIRLAELRINKDLDGLFQNFSTTVSTNIGVTSITKPSNYRWAYSVFVNPGALVAKSMVKKMPQDFVLEYFAPQGKPKYYADVDATTFKLAPAPDANYTIELNYAGYPTPLSTTNQTNIILTKFQDVLWYATLVEQCIFARMFEAKQEYENKYQAAVLAANEELRRERADNTYNVNSPIVSQNRKDRKG